MSKYIIRLVLYIFWIFQTSCNPTLQEGELITVDSVLYDPEGNNIVFTVYTPDTNWKKMEHYASEILTNKGEYSAVGFFYPLDSTPHLKPDGLMPNEYCRSCLVAKYSFDFEKNKFVLGRNASNYLSHFAE